MRAKELCTSENLKKMIDPSSTFPTDNQFFFDETDYEFKLKLDEFEHRAKYLSKKEEQEFLDKKVIKNMAEERH